MHCQGVVGIVQPLRTEGESGLVVRAAATELAALFDGRPIIVVESLLPETVALAGAGARICRAHVLPEGVTLRFGPPRGDAADATPLDHPPTAVLALVAQSPTILKRLAAWWQERGMAPPALIVAESGLAALPELLAVALAEAGAAARRACALDERCVVLRQEVEQLRGSVAALLDTSAGRPPPAAETRIVLAPDAAAAPLRLATGAEARVFEPGLTTTGLARVSLHLAEAASAELSVRVIGAESGRVLCAWRVPSEALPAGWLTLETPEPLPGRPETLMLGVQAEGETGEVALSTAAERPEEPAMTAAVLPPGACLVHPLHMDWGAWHSDAAPAVPRHAPAQMLATARLEGPGMLEAGSGDGARRVVLPAEWGTVRVALGPLPERCAALRCDLRLGSGTAEARLVMARGGAATEWRHLPQGEARPFSLPVGDGRSEVALELRGVGPAVVDIQSPILFAAATRAPEAVEPAAARGGSPPPPRLVQAQPVRALEASYPREQWPEPTDAEAVSRPDSKPHFDEAMLDEQLKGDGWELLDVRLRSLSFRGEQWREVKFKFGVSGDNAVLEFRRAPSWPRAFEVWPGTESDVYGDKFVMVLERDTVRGLDRVAPGRDRVLVAALAAIMPRLVAELAAENEFPACAKAAVRLAERLGAEG